MTGPSTRGAQGRRAQSTVYGRTRAARPGAPRDGGRCCGIGLLQFRRRERDAGGAPGCRGGGFRRIPEDSSDVVDLAEFEDAACRTKGRWTGLARRRRHVRAGATDHSATKYATCCGSKKPSSRASRTVPVRLIRCARPAMPVGRPAGSDRPCRRSGPAGHRGRRRPTWRRSAGRVRRRRRRRALKANSCRVAVPSPTTSSPSPAVTVSDGATPTCSGVPGHEGGHAPAVPASAQQLGADQDRCRRRWVSRVRVIGGLARRRQLNLLHDRWLGGHVRAQPHPGRRQEDHATASAECLHGLQAGADHRRLLRGGCGVEPRQHHACGGAGTNTTGTVSAVPSSALVTAAVTAHSYRRRRVDSAGDDDTNRASRCAPSAAR